MKKINKDFQMTENQKKVSNYYANLSEKKDLKTNACLTPEDPSKFTPFKRKVYDKLHE